MNPVDLGSQYWLIVMHRSRYTQKNLDETCRPIHPVTGDVVDSPEPMTSIDES
jgi:hypothetical protein